MKGTIPFTLLVIIFISSAASLRAEVPVTDYVKEGIAIRGSGRYSEAEAFFVKRLQEDPQQAVYLFELANVYAASHARWKQYPDHPKAAALLEKCENTLRQAVLLDPGFLAAHYNLGIVRKNRGRFEEAREDFKRVIQLEPQSPWAWMQIGETYERQGFFDEAEDAYRKAKEFDYFNPDIDLAIRELEEMKKGRKAPRYPTSIWDEFQAPQGGRVYYSSGAEAEISSKVSMNPIAAIPFVAQTLYKEFRHHRAQKAVEG